ncbi:glycoside hydrolase family 127 protein [Pararhodonellum marinum]|uniref:glycoside hydrolase family 127 protein n=1 Tax=Pararhodonellum marinum TaxID=2755358 RepID=UPI00188EAFFA|nr:glycoside hydrolase family 127 protein [Pararhodonellum marinum]
METNPLFFSLLALFVFSQQAIAQNEPIRFFALGQVELLDSPFLNAQNVDKAYILEMDVDRLLAPYMKEAGIDWQAENYGNWENTGLDGHIGGHYLSALAMMYAASGDEKIKSRLDYMLDRLEEAQTKNGNGYVGGVPQGKVMWEEIGNGKINAGNFSLNQKWVPLYNIHKIYAGLRDAYLYADSGQAKGMLVKLSDWFEVLTKDFTEEQFQEMLISEHGGLNEIFSDVYVITGDRKYMDLAKKMSHHLLLNPLLEGDDKLTGMHANTQIPKVIGFQRIAALENDANWHAASNQFWDNVVNQRSVSIGGNSVREHFHQVTDFNSMLSSEQGPETCNTYNMLRLSEQLFQHSPNSKYMDYYERALYNHILSSQHPEKGGFVYFTPMRPQHYRVYSQPHENFWCCVGSGLENHAKYGQAIYANAGNALYVNLFIPSKLDWKEKETKVIQQTEFPYADNTTLSFQHKGRKNIDLIIRAPKWADPQAIGVKVNGKARAITIDQNGYFTVSGNWRSSDRIELKMPMETKTESLPDGSNWVSYVYGPVVLAAKTGDEDLKGIFADDSRMGHVAAGKMVPLDQTPFILKENDYTLPVKSGEGLTFLVENLDHKDALVKQELVPFFSIHESRYQVYWPEVARNEAQGFRQQLHEKDEKSVRIATLTVDMVAAGEQQPESEHGFQGENTKMGQKDGRFWRNTTGWFQYKLKNPGNAGKLLRISFINDKKGSPFRILINGELLATVQLNQASNQEVIYKDYDVSKITTEELQIRIESIDGLETGKVNAIRLMKSSE